MNLDLDALAQAEAEVIPDEAEERTVTFGGQTFTLPAGDLPAAFWVGLERDNLDMIVHAMFGDDADRFLATGVGRRPVIRLVTQVARWYTGHDVGESKASGDSSSNGSRSSRRASRKNTGSTSGGAVSAPTPAEPGA